MSDTEILSSIRFSGYRRKGPVTERRGNKLGRVEGCTSFHVLGCRVVRLIGTFKVWVRSLVFPETSMRVCVGLERPTSVLVSKIPGLDLSLSYFYRALECTNPDGGMRGVVNLN